MDVREDESKGKLRRQTNLMLRASRLVVVVVQLPKRQMLQPMRLVAPITKSLRRRRRHHYRRPWLTNRITEYEVTRMIPTLVSRSFISQVGSEYFQSLRHIPTRNFAIPPFNIGSTLPPIDLTSYLPSLVNCNIHLRIGKLYLHSRLRILETLKGIKFSTCRSQRQ